MAVPTFNTMVTNRATGYVVTATNWNELQENADTLKEVGRHMAATELTIATGAAEIVQAYHTLDTESDAASDDLDSLAGGIEGMILILRAENDGRTVIIKDNPTGGTGFFDIGGDIYLDDIDLHCAFVYGNDAYWHLIACWSIVREFVANAFQYPNPGTDWTPEKVGAGLGANLAAKTCWLPLNFLKIGDQIISYKIVGDMHEEGGDTCTLDAKIYSVNKADPLTTTDIAGGGIAQVTADGNIDVEAVLTAPEVVVTDKQYGLEITGTTSNVSANEKIEIIGVEIKVIRLT